MTGTSPPPDYLMPDRTAFFLDVDGTVADIVDDPAKARVTREVQKVLAHLHVQSGGAVAMISGRSIAQLDRMLHPLRLPCAGVHGLEMRLHEGELTRQGFDGPAHALLTSAISRFAASHDGLEAEPKPGAVALHFRKRPELAQECQRVMMEQKQRDSRLTLIRGKMVVELIFGSRNKGDAITALMQTPPFAGRQTFYAGDDVTDEAAFHCVNQRGGVSVKIGTDETCALYRLPDPATLVGYIATLTGKRDPKLEQFHI